MMVLLFKSQLRADVDAADYRRTRARRLRDRPLRDPGGDRGVPHGPRIRVAPDGHGTLTSMLGIQ